MREPTDSRTRPLFSVTEAAAHAGTSAATVRDWFCGNEARGSKPLFPDRVRSRDSQIWLSFLEVVEVIVARRFRRHSVTTDQLRHTRQHARTKWEVEYPLAERRLKLLGGRVLDTPGEAIDLEWPATQPALPELAAYATEVFEYNTIVEPIQDAAWATRFYPAGPAAPLMVDPQFAGGAVTILDRGLTLETIVQRWHANESIAFIASDFRFEESTVEAALRFASAS